MTAPSSSLLALLNELVTTELSEAIHSSKQDEVNKQVATSCTPILKVVEALGAFLTIENDAQRARATNLLAEVVEAVPSAATSESDVRHLAEFFTSRLTDWPAVRGALRGCLALLSRRSTATSEPAAATSGPVVAKAGQQQQQQPAAVAEVGEDAAVVMMRTCASHVFIRALSQQDRTLALRLLVAAMQGYGDAVLAANLDLLEYVISSVDGEKDPRCLLLCFAAVRCLLDLYHRQPEESLCHERLEEGAEELFEVLACYFPVTFTPPPGDPNRITRQELAEGLEAALVAERLFAPHLLPLAFEKLSSTLRQAKLDSMSLLAAAAEGFGPVPLASHVSTLWAALRPELAAPAAEGLLPADQAAAEEMAAAAASCLTRCVAAFQRAGSENDGAAAAAADAPAGASLADAVLADAGLQDVLACVQHPGGDPALHRRSTFRARFGAAAAEALCRAGGSAAGRAARQLLPPLLDAVEEQPGSSSNSTTGWQSLCLGWSVVVGLLEALASAPSGTGNGRPAHGAASVDASLVRQTVAAAAAALFAAAASLQAVASVAEAEEEEEEEETEGVGAVARWPVLLEDCTPHRAAALQLAALAAVFADDCLAAALTWQDAESAVACTLLLLLGPASQLRQAAVAALAAVAGGSHASVLLDAALPQLVTAALQLPTAAAALATLQALAAASQSLQPGIVAALDRTIQQLLPVAVAEAPGAANGSRQILQQLLQASQQVIAAWDAGTAAAAPDCFLQLGRHMFDAVQLLPPQAAAAAGPELQCASAALAYRAVTAAPAEQQVLLASAAALALLHAAPAALGGLHSAVCCSLLVALRQEAVQGLASEQPLAALVQHLVALALAETQQESPAGHWAAEAVAALLNKWRAADAAGLAACTSFVLHQQLFPACGILTAAASGDAGLPAAAPAAWGSLAAVSRALAMRGSRDADAAVTRVVGSLAAAEQCWQQEGAAAEGLGGSGAGEELAPGIQAAAGFLGAVLGGGAGSGTSLRPGSKLAHARSKPLWQQRTYTGAASQLLPLLQRSVHSAQGATAQAAAMSQGDEEAAPPLASPVLLLGLAHLLCAAPAGVLQQEQRRMLPWMLQCLAGLQQGPLAGSDLLLSLLLLVRSALESTEGKQQVEAELLPPLLRVLLQLAVYRPAAAVRETALQCLLLLVDLPYTSLHPHRRSVARVLACAVDDSRRAVRLRAARCRLAWSAF